MQHAKGKWKGTSRKTTGLIKIQKRAACKGGGLIIRFKFHLSNSVKKFKRYKEISNLKHINFGWYETIYI